MIWLYYLLAGAIGGLLGGMGLGGGTLLMPILTFGLGVTPKVAAWLNLVSFLPAAAVSLVFHVKNKLVVWRETAYLLIFSFVGVAAAFLWGRGLSEEMTRRAFGYFLVMFGSISLFFVLFGYFKKTRK